MNAIMSTFIGREDLVVEQAVSTFLRRIVLNCEYCKERLKLGYRKHSCGTIETMQ